MHWADKIANEIISSGNHQPYWVDDMKTPSGRVHVGALRGVLIHDLVYKALLDKGVEAHYTYVFNDMDTMDSLPNYLDKAVYEKYMGTPLYKIPAPDPKFENFAMQYAQDFIEIFNKLGATPEIVWSHNLYESGKMNEAITTALNHAEEIRAIYLRVAKQQKPGNWYPFQVICPKCGKMGCTNTDDWDGETVHFTCEPSLVEWAHGCGYEGRVSPFNGTGKLMWKIDWPAHWATLGITIEGAGKDHSSDGGSRDIAGEVLKEVFKYPEPYDIPYEWFLIGGHKMSSSRGVGTSAREFSEIMPYSLGRFLFVRTKFNRQMNFDPSGMTIPDLFDEYDRMAKQYWQGEKTDYARIFELSHSGEMPSEHFVMRFHDVARIIQDPKVDIIKASEEVKGSVLTDYEKTILEERIRFAKLWLADYAPSDAVFKVVESNAPVELTDNQKVYMREVATMLEVDGLEPESFQQELYQKTKSMGIAPKDAFNAIYQVMLGKTHGPKAAWLLLENKAKAIELIRSIETSQTAAVADTATTETEAISEHFHINQDVKQALPGMFYAITTLTGVNVKKDDSKLEIAKQKLLESIKITVEQIAEMPTIQAYRSIFKKTHVWGDGRRPSPEALLRRIAQGKGLYTINTAADAYNLAVIETGVSMGGFDTDTMSLPITLRLTDAGEKVLLLGDTEPTETKAGEIVYSDTDKILTLDLDYRDNAATKLTTDTKNIIFFADGAPGLTETQKYRGVRLLKKTTK